MITNKRQRKNNRERSERGASIIEVMLIITAMIAGVFGAIISISFNGPIDFIFISTMLKSKVYLP